MAKRRQQPYWPRYYVIWDSGFLCSHKDALLAQKHAQWHREVNGPSGGHAGVIYASNNDDLMRKAEPIWERYRKEREARKGK